MSVEMLGEELGETRDVRRDEKGAVGLHIPPFDGARRLSNLVTAQHDLENGKLQLRREVVWLK